MTIEEKRVAIAKACGLPISICDFPQPIPDYFKDLNAIHEAILYGAEKNGFGFQAVFQLRLQEIVERRRRDLSREQIGWWMNNATADQRADAFGLTLRLWEDAE